MNYWPRGAIAAAGIAMLLAGCGKGPISESHAETTTAPPASQSVSATEIDSLVVPMDQVPHVGDGLRHSSVSKQPSPTPSVADGGPEPGSPCAMLDLPAGDLRFFGNDPLAFRDVRYTGFGNVSVAQAIGVYPDRDAATGVFDNIVDGLNTCNGSNDSRSATFKITSTGASWQTSYTSARRSGESMTRICDDEGRSVRNVIVRVRACMSNAPEVAAAVADAITAKINNSA